MSMSKAWELALKRFIAGVRVQAKAHIKRVLEYTPTDEDRIVDVVTERLMQRIGIKLAMIECHGDGGELETMIYNLFNAENENITTLEDYNKTIT